MVEAILTELSKTSFDFRNFANPSDPLSALFGEWVPYYRLKFCVAKVVQPKSILEVGVRYGYSARSFLEASPSASFTGVDLDCDSFGGQRGALDWARRITARFNATYIVADSQQMKRLPGGIYDLIHVDGQQDSLGTFHDLRRAVSQGRWVLLDRYFWTRPNFFNANDFLLKFKDVISYAITIPGYAGELLIRVSDRYLSAVSEVSPAGGKASINAMDFYDSHYYLHDCGGHESFRTYRGKHISDVRLRSLLALSQLAPGGPALDLGCGRGEMTYQLAVSGREVTAIDYSATAIELAQNCFCDETKDVKGRVEFIRGDVTNFDVAGRFKLAIAGDLIEHLNEKELAKLIEEVAGRLDDDGVFAIHTFPNLWYYKKHYPRLRAAAQQLGAFLPVEPRTRYELLMHINEQSPAALRRSLAKAFRYVKVWVAGPEAPAEYLLRRCSIGQLIRAPDIYALASRSPLDLDRAKRLLTQPKLHDASYAKIHVSVDHCPGKVTAGTAFHLLATVANESTELLSSMPPHPVNVSYHWFVAGTARAVIFDGLRTNLPRVLAPGETSKVLTTVEAPRSPGLYELAIMLVQEGCCWFDKLDGAASGTKRAILVV
jgi:SAM-dependent methyltransferase